MILNSDSEKVTPKEAAKIFVSRMLEIESYRESVRDEFPDSTERESDLIIHQLKTLIQRISRRYL